MKIVTDINSKTQKENEVLRQELTRSQKRIRRQKWKIRSLMVLLAIIGYATAIYVGSLALTPVLLKWFPPVTPPVITIKHVEAKELEAPKFPDVGDCEQYRPVVEKYFGKLTDEALFVAKNESGCIADRISPKNSDGSRDYCLLQINNEPLAAQSLDVCVRRAWEKYQDGRVGEKNWSAWYAVCDVNAKPKYPKTINNCN